MDECQNYGDSNLCNKWIIDKKEKLQFATGDVNFGEKIEGREISLNDLKKADEICSECRNFEQKR